MWKRKAYEYFQRGLYDLARRAFRNAGLTHNAAVASAYVLREFADLSSITVGAYERGERYSRAAIAFDQVASETDEAQKLVYHRIAGECFAKVPDHGRAAASFENALDYDQAVRLYRDAGNFERTIQLLCEHKDALKPDSLLKVQYALQIFCLLNGRTRSVIRSYIV